MSEAGADAEIRKIGVLPALRRRGIAADAFRSVSKANAAERFLIDVAADNDSGRAFYASLGFREISRRKKYYSSGADAVVMEFPALTSAEGS